MIKALAGFDAEDIFLTWLDRADRCLYPVVDKFFEGITSDRAFILVAPRTAIVLGSKN
jgi:hypothetical protein